MSTARARRSAQTVGGNCLRLTQTIGQDSLPTLRRLPASSALLGRIPPPVRAARASPGDVTRAPSQLPRLRRLSFLPRLHFFTTHRESLPRQGVHPGLQTLADAVLVSGEAGRMLDFSPICVRRARALLGARARWVGKNRERSLHWRNHNLDSRTAPFRRTSR